MPDVDWVPSRLLEVSETGVRLVLRDEVAPQHKYMSLSHCWGDIDFYRLTQETFSALREGTTLIQLPLTFQHAVMVANHLEVKYLWIDALCILQDSPADWEQEAMLMHKVYSQSFLNLSADVARDSREGLFYEGSPNDIAACSVVLPSTRSCWTAGTDTEFAIFDGYTVQDLNLTPIHKRAWVLQERLLAPRTLHFGRYQLFWHCLNDTVCERYPVSLPDYYLFLEADAVKWKSKLFKLAKDTTASRSTLHAEWAAVVSAYSSSYLTYPSDKIVAFSGVAKLFQKVIHDSYVVGFWRENLIASLDWNVVDRGADTIAYTPSPAYREHAPTWSWLSADGDVSFKLIEFDDVTPLCEVVDIQIEYITDDIFGPVKFGFLYLRGCLRRAQITQNINPYSDRMFDLHLDGRTHFCSVRPDILGSEMAELAAKGETYLFHLYYTQTTDDIYVGHNGYRHKALILKCVSKSNGVYERIGYFQYLARTADQWLEKISMEPDSEADSLAYHAFDSMSKLHTIIIR